MTEGYSLGSLSLLIRMLLAPWKAYQHDAILPNYLPYPNNHHSGAKMLTYESRVRTNPQSQSMITNIFVVISWSPFKVVLDLGLSQRWSGGRNKALSFPEGGGSGVGKLPAFEVSRFLLLTFSKKFLVVLVEA